MGIPVTQCTYIYGDNKSVLVNSNHPDSQLKKKSNSVSYHHVREGCALDKWRCCYVNTNDNAADILSKSLPAGEKRLKFCKIVLHFLGFEENTEVGSIGVDTYELISDEWTTCFIKMLKDLQPSE